MSGTSSGGWETLDPIELERQFNPRAWLGDESTNEILDEWKRRSAERRSSLPGPFDVPYGTHPSERLDVHRSSSSRRSVGDDGGSVEVEAGEGETSKPPLVIFIHGGWWRALDKSDMDCHVFDMHNHRGWHVINVNYPLCPSVPLTRLYVSLERAVRFIFKNLPAWNIETRKAFLVGHSVGGHAVSYLSSRFGADRLNGVVAVSGVYDVGVVRSISVQRDVRMTEEESVRFNLLAPPSSDEADSPPSSSSSSAGAASSAVPFMVTTGGDESPFWIRQSESYARKLLYERRESGDDDDDENVVWGLVEGADHFSVMDEIVRPGSAWSVTLDRFVSSNHR